MPGTSAAGPEAAAAGAGFRHVKIVATLGPATDAPGLAERLIRAGVSVFRLNFSHGEFPDHERRLRAVREAARRAGAVVAVLGDLQGPKIRLGSVPEPGIELQAGDDVLLSPGVPGVPGGPATSGVVLPCEYPLGREVLPGHRVLINDGAVRLLALESRAGDPAGSLRCRVTTGGPVSARKGVNVPDSALRVRAITDRDWQCVGWAVEHGLDYLALSFVRTPEEVVELKEALRGMCSLDFKTDQTGAGSLIPVIAKIEKPQAVERIDGILEAADGIMVARGDLGVEMEISRVPVVQKRLVAKADEWGKPCIVATQMLESMIQNASPTRAEASDVANAVFDGADAVMLSGETAVGANPLLVVETMGRIIGAAEERLAELPRRANPPERLIKSRYRTAALAHGAWHMASDLGARLIVCWSQEGGTARYLSQNNFGVPIVAYSSDERQTRRMALLRGVLPVHRRPPESGKLADWNRDVEADLLARGLVAHGDVILLLCGKPLGKKGATNCVAVHTIGDGGTGFLGEESPVGRADC